MVNVAVCVGSSCHIKGSYRVIQRLQELIEEHGIGDQVQLQGSFCLSACGKGVTLAIDGKLYCAAGPEEAEQLFNRYVLPQAEV